MDPTQHAEMRHQAVMLDEETTERGNHAPWSRRKKPCSVIHSQLQQLFEGKLETIFISTDVNWLTVPELLNEDANMQKVADAAKKDASGFLDLRCKKNSTTNQKCARFHFLCAKRQTKFCKVILFCEGVRWRLRDVRFYSLIEHGGE